MCHRSCCSSAMGSRRWDARREHGRLAGKSATVSTIGWSCSSDVLDESPVEFGPAITEEAEGGAVLFGRREVERCDEHAGVLRAELREDVAALVADEAVAVETLALLVSDAVGGDDGHDVRNSMADHRTPPQPRRIEVGVMRLGPDC